MRLTATLPDAGERMIWRDAHGAERCVLWHHACTWACADRPLAFRLLAPEPLAVPAPEASEPAVSALARLLQAIRGTGALVMLDHPSQVFAADRLHGAEGVRLFGITDEADLAAWDGLLALGLPVYGVRGRLTVEVISPHPASVASALAYGVFTCDEGLPLAGLHEDRAGVAYTCDRPTTAVAIIRGGFEADRLAGAAGQPVQRRDQGNELVVRLVVRDDGGNTCWTQPRFVLAPASGHQGHHHAG